MYCERKNASFSTAYTHQCDKICNLKDMLKFCEEWSPIKGPFKPEIDATAMPV